MYRKSVKISLVFVYLVIIAGAMVRMTGSGMGCPDWPKCFGYYIPPTDVSELQWSSDRNFKKGQVIIHDETLQVAKDNFVTSKAYNASNWQLYTKHDYATFNVWHTWIEYINRLFGALSGIAIFIMALLSFKKMEDEQTHYNSVLAQCLYARFSGVVGRYGGLFGFGPYKNYHPHGHGFGDSRGFIVFAIYFK